MPTIIIITIIIIVVITNYLSSTTTRFIKFPEAALNNLSATYHKCYCC